MEPTQTAHPWRATGRTIFAGSVAFLTLLPVVATTAQIDTVPAVAQVLVVTGAVTRVLALPGVEAFLETYLPWLAAKPAASPGDRFDVFDDEEQ